MRLVQVSVASIGEGKTYSLKVNGTQSRSTREFMVESGGGGGEKTRLFRAIKQGSRTRV